MKEKLTRNLGLKVLAIILAALLWLLITNIDDPITTKYFDDVTVTILNKKEIEELGQVYEIIEGETIDFTVAARRSIADKLSVSDFKVTADLSKLSDVNATTINISCPRYGDAVTVTDGQNQVMKVNLEEMVEKNFKVNVVQKGEPAEGYYVAEKSAGGMMLRVSGPKSKIERISEIIVEVDVSDISETFKTSEEPKAIDKDGNEIDASNLKFSSKSVPVTISMYKTKIIDLIIDTQGKAADGYVMTKVEYEPKEIEVAGPDAALDSIGNLRITEKIDGARENIEKEINIQEKLPEGLIVSGDNKTVAINIVIEKTEKKELQIKPADIEIRNKPGHLQAVILTVAPITVEVEGSAEELKEVTAKNFKPYIDLLNYSSGTYEVAVETGGLTSAKISNNPFVSVYLTE